jgi:hypothetical protein
MPVQHGSDRLTPWVHDQTDINLQVQTNSNFIQEGLSFVFSVAVQILQH